MSNIDKYAALKNKYKEGWMDGWIKGGIVG